jgi:hypothetical protein
MFYSVTVIPEFLKILNRLEVCVFARAVKLESLCILWKTILNAIFITRSVIFFFFFNLQKVQLLCLGLFSIVNLIFF